MINKGQKEIKQLIFSESAEDVRLGIILALKTQSWAWLRWNINHKCLNVMIGDGPLMYTKNDIIIEIDYTMKITVTKRYIDNLAHLTENEDYQIVE